MIKETVISIIIIVGIVILEIITQKYTNNSVERMTNLLIELKTEMQNQNLDNVKIKIENLDNEWQKMHDKLAYYVEHDELEKVDSAIVQMNSYVETGDLSFAIAQLEEGKFVLEHIEDKTAFNLQNIF